MANYFQPQGVPQGFQRQLGPRQPFGGQMQPSGGMQPYQPGGGGMQAPPGFQPQMPQQRTPQRFGAAPPLGAPPPNKSPLEWTEEENAMMRYGPPPSPRPVPQGQQDWLGGYQPWDRGDTPQGWWPSDADFRLMQYQSMLPFQQAGYFDPRGNRALIEGGRMNAANISQALQRQSQLAGQARGMDPTQRASFEMQSMIGGQGQQSAMLMQAMQDAYRRQADYAERLSLGQFGLAGQRQQQDSPNGFQLGFGPASFGFSY